MGLVEGKVIIVTGASSGIGEKTAEVLAAEGAKVVLAARRKEKLEDVANRIIAAGGEAYTVSGDVSVREDCDRIAEETVKKYGRIDVLVNNAGVAPKVRLDLLETTEESFDFVLDTNLKGPFFMCQAMARQMIRVLQTQEDYHPRIINISSVSAYASSVNRGEYCISKAGVSMVTKLFADRLAQFGIPVFEVRPGIIRTDMTSAVMQKYEEMIANGLTPIPRMGEPEDVAKCVSVLAGGQLDFATGQVLNADGGFHLRRL